MRKKMLLIGLIIICAGNLHSYHSDGKFPIGTYSWKGTEDRVTMIAPYLEEAHFNIVGESTYDPESFNILNSHYIDVWNGDYRWEPDKKGVKKATRCNFYTYEVEYYDYNSSTGLPNGITLPDGWINELCFYNVEHDVGIKDDDYELDSDYLIICEPPDAGYVIKELYYHSSPGYIEGNRLNNQIFQDKQETYYLKFKMRIEQGSCAPTDPVCSVGLKVYCKDDLLHYVPLTSTEPDLYPDTLLIMQDFINTEPYYDYHEFEYSVERDIIEALPDTVLPIGRGRYKAFFPEIYYHGNGILHIDNVTIDDDVYRDLDDGVYTDAILSAVNENNFINRIAEAGTDEPIAPQFETFRKVNEILTGITDVMSATFLYGYWRACDYGFPLYNALKLFSYVTEPTQLMPDLYPSRPNMDWTTNPEDYQGSHWKHIQTRINLMTEVYRNTKEECLTREIKFFPITQTFGKREQNEAGEYKWNHYLLPPSEMQKALCFLPLCYGADGLFYYQFDNRATPEHPGTKNSEDEKQTDYDIRVAQDRERAPYYFVGLVNDLDEDDILEIYPQFYAVKDANEEIACIGYIIKDLTWDSDKTAALMSDPTTINLGLNGINSVDINAEDPTGLENHSDYTEGYNGYVECSVYTQDDTIYFMLVNRRGNFPYPGYIDPDGFLNPDSIPDIPDSAFAPADPQEVAFSFSDIEPWREYAFKDMYTEDSVIVQVSATGELEASLPIEPGDGRLIQMKIHPPIPSVIDSLFVVPANKHCIIDYPITVEEGGMLTLSEGVTLHFRENGSIEVYGGIEIGDNVKFTAPEGESCDGIYLYNTTAEITMNNVTFERCKLHNESLSLNITSSDFTNSGIEQSGDVLELYYTNFDNSSVSCFWESGKSPLPAYIEVDVINCYFENCSDYAVSITNYPLYELKNNIITGCEGGFMISNSGNPKKCIISDNNIHNNSGAGIWLHNSYADICERNIIKNNYFGIVGLDNSSITMIGNTDYPHSTIKDNMHQELIFDTSSFPTKISYNKVIDDAYTTGSHDQYLIRTIEFLFPITFDIKDNYWGTMCENWDEGDGDNRFHPEGWYEYLPIWIPGPPVDPKTLTGLEELYAEADSLIQIEEYEIAKQVYRDIIEQYPESKYSIFSMRNLLPLETVSGQDFASLKEYYLTDSNCNYDDERSKLSSYLANYCNIKMENYPDAISFFEDIILNHETELDSIYAVIDAGYTYLLMDGGGKSYYVGKIAELKPQSVVEFEEMRDKLLAKALGLPEQYEEEIIPENVFYLGQNYPNPMRNSTTISFSIPKDAKNSEIKIYNVKGQIVKSLECPDIIGINAKATGSLYSINWDGKDNNGKKLSNGIYLYQLETDIQKSKVKKILLLNY